MSKLVFSSRRIEIPASNGLGTKYSSRVFLKNMLPGEKTKTIQELKEKIDRIEKRIILLKQKPGTNERTIKMLKSMKAGCERDLQIIRNAEPVKITDESTVRGSEITKTDYANWRAMGGRRH